MIPRNVNKLQVRATKRLRETNNQHKEKQWKKSEQK